MIYVLPRPRFSFWLDYLPSSWENIDTNWGQHVKPHVPKTIKTFPSTPFHFLWVQRQTCSLSSTVHAQFAQGTGIWSPELPKTVFGFSKTNLRIKAWDQARSGRATCSSSTWKPEGGWLWAQEFPASRDNPAESNKTDQWCGTPLTSQDHKHVGRQRQTGMYSRPDRVKRENLSQE